MDHARFKEAFDKNYRVLVYSAYKYVGAWDVAQDIVADAFVSVFKRGYDDAVKVLFESVKNKCIDHIRAGKRRQIKHFDLFEYRLDDVDGWSEEEILVASFEDAWIEAETISNLYLAIKKLSKSDQELVELLFFSKKKSAAVAKELGMQPGTIRSKKRHILNRLRIIMKIGTTC